MGEPIGIDRLDYVVVRQRETLPQALICDVGEVRNGIMPIWNRESGHLVVPKNVVILDFVSDFTGI